MKKDSLHTRLTLLITVMLALCFAAGAQVDVKLADNANLGQVLTDADGNALYFFTKDARPDSSACVGGCLSAWPVFYVNNPSVGAGLDAADFGSFQRADGSMQSTYKSWPLYYFAGDNAPGDANGEGVNNIWYVAKPDYSIMLINNTLTGANGVTYTSEYLPGVEEVQYFVDAYGRTLYVFMNDNYNDNNFTASDFGNNGVWPIYEEGLQGLPSALDESLFGLIDVFGRQQLTYKGWPLYYFGQDTQRGANKGVSVPVPGVWPVAVKDIDPATPNAAREIVSLLQYSVFPNPFDGHVTLSLSLEAGTALSVGLYNSLGQEVRPLWQGELPEGASSLNFEGLGILQKGVYFLRLRHADGGVATIPLVK